MDGFCVVYGCTNRKQKGGDISFLISHIIMQNFCKSGYKQYKDWFPNQHSFICSTHLKTILFGCYTMKER